MGKDPMKENENVYFRARKKAALYDSRLSSREGAAEMLGISVSTLADYELGNTKVVPVDKVVLMADLYNSPELENGYCKNECPIGRMRSISTEDQGIAKATLHLFHEFDYDALKDTRDAMLNLAVGGLDNDEEKQRFYDVLMKLERMETVISEIQMIGRKALKDWCPYE